MSDPRTQLRVQVYITQETGFGTLQFSEETSIPAGDFQALSAILSRFHDLFNEIKASQQRADKGRQF